MEKIDVKILIDKVDLECMEEVSHCCITNDAYKEKEKEVQRFIKLRQKEYA